ncbi:hypothetical protein, partial [Neoroseomonas rubea]|uniref:hypothetical protein n=1 Tax=Neoroseomonas rubea TaxID=2748666 RepID=UPI0018DFCCF0
VALVVLRGAVAALPTAAGWAVLGSVGAVAWRGALGDLGSDGWLPGEQIGTAGILAEAVWCVAIAAAAWHGVPATWLGPGLALLVATTRIGGYGEALVPILWEETLRQALLLSVNIVAGFAAGLIIVLLAGWGLAILLRVPAARVAPERLLATLAAAAGIGHMLRL